jgi:anaerobic dimethyl sulfoxide reductase subunit B (iron-sulfur subunit)
MQLGFHFDQTRCIGCHACDVVCKDWHDIQDVSVHWRRLDTLEEGTFPNLFVAFLSLSCCHCAEPACASACPVTAITKNEQNGIVAVDAETCLGRDACGSCRDACPYDVPQFGVEEDAKMQKCTFCPDRLEEGESPACVGACPVRALDAGPMEELKAKYGAAGDGTGFRYDPALGPCLVVKPKGPARG